MGTIISCNDVSFNYENFTRKVLKNINLNIQEGELVIITGPTGAGKTTLCQVLNGVIPHFMHGDLSGEIIVDGLITKNTPVYKLAESVGMVFQDPDTQLFGMTVEEDIVFGPSNLGYKYDECMQRVEKSLSDLSISHLRERKPMELSGGQKQSVAIAGVYAMLPKIIVLDEPTSMLDPIGKENIFAIIKDVNKKYGITVVLVEHEMSEIVRYADRVVVMDRGEIMLQGTVREVFAEVNKIKELGLSVPHTIELGVLLKNDGIIDDIPLVPESMVDALMPYVKRISHAKLDVVDDRERRFRNSPNIIEAENIEFSYFGETNQLNDVSVSFKKGDFVAIIGQNGAGKTTLARNIIGLLKPTKGAILVNGENIVKSSVAELSATIGYCFQNPDEQIFKDSVEEELYFGPTNHHRDPESIKENIEQILKDFGLQRYREVWPKYLSKGERQRLTMGAIIAMDPEVVIVDEPTTGQDWKETIWIMELLKKINQKGKTIIIITHNMEIVNRYCNRVLTMRGGRVVLDGEPREVFTHTEELKKSFVSLTDITRIAQALPFMPNNIISVEEFYTTFKNALEMEVTAC